MTTFLSEPSTRRLRSLVALPSLAARRHVPIASLDLEEAGQAPLHAEDVAGRLEIALTSVLKDGLPDESTTPQEYRQALSTLMRQTRITVRKIDADPLVPLTLDDAIALESVIRADGTRPSLLIRDGGVTPRDPLAGDWGDLLETTRPVLSKAIRAVGRVEPEHPTARDYFGTAWVIDAEAGLALTNLHVVEAMWKRLPHLMEPNGRGFRVHKGVFVEFSGESGSTDTNRFQVVQAIISHTTDGPGFSRLDAAVLQLEPTPDNDADLPPAIGVSIDLSGGQGSLSSFCLVGFPGPPRYVGGVHEGVDWTWVHSTLFGNRYGVKRLAPGLTHRPLGSVQEDNRRWIFGHDVTTLGGSSGSPILNWLDASPSSFGLHFAGITLESNFAHAMGACIPELESLGVPLGTSIP